MKKLIVIPARGGSKGIPGKNIKTLNGKPLIHYSLDYARQFADDEDICITTDSTEIGDSVRQMNYELPFLRPAELATDTAGSYEVLRHALNFYTEQGKNYDALVLLQPTSPFRKNKHLKEALALFNEGIDMVVSVSESSANPYYNLFEQDEEGFLHISKGSGGFLRRQDVPPVYEYNGSIYVINVKSLLTHVSFAGFSKVVKYAMEPEYSIDLDTPADWNYAEFLAAQQQ
ncbi:MAG: acylneuraminate cytidylyltransferase family protein [Chitinophagaceae bacterium]